MLQFLVAGALVVAWIWMLGRPLLAAMARRSRRDSVDHFRYQQAVLGRSAEDDFERWERLAGFHPIADWRAQPVYQRRLQVMLGFALAAFSSSLLAIALRGMFIRLFLVMTVAFALYLVVAAVIGSRELRSGGVERRVPRSRPAEVGAERVERRPDRAHGRRDAATAEDDDEWLLDRDDVAGGLFDDGFFEPIPELERLSEPPVPAVASSDTDGGGDEQVETETAATVDDGARPDEAVAGTERSAEPTFTSAPAARTRPPRRPKARPIYIESELDELAEDDSGVRAVGD